MNYQCYCIPHSHCDPNFRITQSSSTLWATELIGATYLVAKTLEPPCTTVKKQVCNLVDHHKSPNDNMDLSKIIILASKPPEHFLVPFNPHPLQENRPPTIHTRSQVQNENGWNDCSHRQKKPNWNVDLECQSSLEKTRARTLHSPRAWRYAQ